MAKPNVGTSSLLCICIRQNRCASDSTGIYTNYRTTQALCIQLPLKAFLVFVFMFCCVIITNTVHSVACIRVKGIAVLWLNASIYRELNLQWMTCCFNKYMSHLSYCLLFFIPIIQMYLPAVSLLTIHPSCRETLQRPFLGNIWASV